MSEQMKKAKKHIVKIVLVSLIIINVILSIYLYFKCYELNLLQRKYGKLRKLTICLRKVTNKPITLDSSWYPVSCYTDYETYIVFRYSNGTHYAIRLGILSDEGYIVYLGPFLEGEKQ